MDIKEDLKRLGLADILETDENGLLEIFPSENRAEGFFIAKLKKR